jgi:hypothetical protein
MASVTGSGSRVAFFGHGNGGRNVNVDLTTNGGGDQPPPMPGKFNIEVFTITPGTVAGGYQASAFIPGATLVDNNVVSNIGQTNVTEELLTGSFKLVDETGHEAIQIVGSAGGGDSMSVVGSTGDTIIGSSVAGTQQLVDASGRNHLTDPGPETILGGDAPVTVLAGVGDSIVGGSGDMLIKGGSNDTIAVGSGAITIQGGVGDSIIPGTGGIVSIRGGHGHLGDGPGEHEHDGPGDDPLADTVGTTFVDRGQGASTVVGFNSLTDDIQSAASVDPDGRFLGSSHATAVGTTVSFTDGSTMFLAGVTDAAAIHFIK